jgi:uncharacterized protein
MIAKFPSFSPLELNHKDEIQTLTSKFEPYSDFNFVSLFCWNTAGSTKISDLNGNLVINLPDYITGEPVYSLLGDSKIDSSLEDLLQVTPRLRMVPEVVIKNISDPHKFYLEEDWGHFDYIYSLQEHATMPGGKFKEKRKKANKFERAYAGRYRVDELALSNSAHKQMLRDVFRQWATVKNKPAEESRAEGLAIDRLWKNASSLDLIGLLVTVDGKASGFSITEIVHSQNAIYHFHKTLPIFENIDVFLTRETAARLCDKGATAINWEQDLGIAGLRASKQSYKPIRQLKKFTVRK